MPRRSLQKRVGLRSPSCAPVRRRSRRSSCLISAPRAQGQVRPGLTASAASRECSGASTRKVTGCRSGFGLHSSLRSCEHPTSSGRSTFGVSRRVREMEACRTQHRSAVAEVGRRLRRPGRRVRRHRGSERSTPTLRPDALLVIRCGHEKFPTLTSISGVRQDAPVQRRPPPLLHQTDARPGWKLEQNHRQAGTETPDREDA